jgi:hypothetical protein
MSFDVFIKILALKQIDFDKEAPWLKTATALDLTFQVTFNANFFKRDLDNTIKTFQDAIFTHLGLNDSKVVSIHGWKTIMPGASEELICVKLKESNFQYTIQGKTDETQKKTKRPKVYLGGTTTGEDWREDIIKKLKKEKINCFNPVVDLRTEETVAEEETQKDKKCDLLLYVITNEEEMSQHFILRSIIHLHRKNRTKHEVALRRLHLYFTEKSPRCQVRA